MRLLLLCALFPAMQGVLVPGVVQQPPNGYPWAVPYCERGVVLTSNPAVDCDAVLDWARDHPVPAVKK